MNSVYNILAGILNIGNVDFIEKEDQHLPIVTIENPKLTDVGKLFSTATVAWVRRHGAVPALANYQT